MGLVMGQLIGLGHMFGFIYWAWETFWDWPYISIPLPSSSNCLCLYEENKDIMDPPDWASGALMFFSMLVKSSPNLFLGVYVLLLVMFSRK